MIPGDDESLYAKLGDCYANDDVLFFFCYLGIHYLSDTLNSGGSKQLYLPNPSINTDAHTPLHHARPAPPVMPKIMNSVANSRESHDDYQQLSVLCAYSIACKFRLGLHNGTGLF